MAHDNHRSQDSTGETRIVDSYELSPTQEGMLFHDLLGGETGIDLEQIVWTITGAFDEQPLIAAFQQVVSRHPILRTRFRHDADGRPVQEVVEAVEIPVERLDLTRDERPDTSCRFEEALALDRARGIDLSRAPAMRLTIVDWSENEHRVVWTFHHALLDGRSFPLVLREVFAFQDAAEAGEALDLPGPRPYREYIEFLRELDLTSAEDYWRTFLASFTAPTPLVIDHPAGDEARPVPIQGISEQRLSRETTTTLREFAASRSVTLNTLLQAAWAIVLHRHSGESDVVFGATRACRHSAFPDADEMVGLFINTLPVRVQVDPDGFIDDLLKEVRSIQIGLREHEHTPLAKVQGWSEVPRGRRLFDTIVVYENRTIDATLRAFDGHGPRLGFSYHGQTNYPLTLVAYGDDQMLIRLENDRRRVADAPAVRMLGHLVKVLTALPGYSGRRVGELPLLSDGERAALLSSLAVSGFAADRCLHERFEERARMCPGRVAVVCDGVSLSYGELERRANGVALRLRSLGVERGVLVALRMERSLDLVVGILGILKAGGAYLPLDPAYPKERVEFMLADSRVRVVVTESAFASDFGDSATQLLLLDEERGEAEQGPPGEVTPDDLAYVIYTSGSTGKPKGVLISHYNVTRLFDATEGWFEFGEDDVWTLFHSYAFDFSVWEMWGALLYGGRLVVVPYWVSRSPDDFRELLLREGVSVLNQTPSAFRQLLQADVNAGAPVQTNLRYVIFGGEALELQSLRPWFERHGEQQPKLVNMYGITETTVHVTYRPITLHDLEGGAGSVIGTPIPDLRVVLLDAQGALAPIGVPAEMYVGGAGVSRGYLERPELTSERFVPDTFAADAGAKLYRTGDLARRLENGDLEYLGRIDDQVKLRGFRIELGEIEAVLAEHAGVSDCAVLVREDAPGDKRLVAYLVGQGEGLLEELKAQLKTQLPEYMVPAHIVLLPTLPLTPNGKLDRKALPEPDPEALTSGTPYVAPRTPTEETLAEIWTAVLGARRVGVDDDFFELGGDSILTIQIIARSRQAGVHFTPQDLANGPTIAQLAPLVRSAETATHAESEALPGPLVPTPIHRWFLEQRFADADHWNQAFLFEVPAGIDAETLERALGHVAARHDALGLRVTRTSPDWTVSFDATSTAPSVTRIDLAQVAPQDHAAHIERIARTAQAQLDIQRGPLLAAVHFDREDDPGRLLLVVHHLAVDGVSWRILLDDLEAAYVALQADASPPAIPRSADFRRWSQTLADYAANADLRASLARWLEIDSVDGRLPTDMPQAAENREEFAREVIVSLDESETDALLHRVPARYRTQINDVLLTALALALREWTGRDAHRVDVEGHGREEWIGPVDLSRTVGWFTTLYPAVLDLTGAEDEGSALKLVKEERRALPDRGLSYGVLRYAAPDPGVRQQLSKTPPADILFNYLGQFDQVVAGSELFSFADEPTGAWHGPANERTHRLEIVALVRDGRFEARWIFGAARERPAVVERVALSFVNALRRVVQHCSTSDTSGYTPSDFPSARLDQETLDRVASLHTEIEDIYPLSPMQRLFLAVEADGARLGFEQWVFGLRGPLNAAVLREAWESTAARHSMLRTAFVTEGMAEPLQIVERRPALPWDELDWTGRGAEHQKDALNFLLRSDRERGFDVRVAPLNRVTLIRLADDEHRLVWSTHHLCVDGWSWPVIFRAIGEAYEAQLQENAPRLPTASRYGAYIEWLSSSAPDSREFWTNYVAGLDSPTPLPYETTPTGDVVENHVEASLRVDSSTTAALQQRARDLRVTVNVLIQGAWAVLLSHMSERDEIVFGAAFSGRPAELPGVETLVGPCVNNLPVRVRLDVNRSTAEWLRELHGSNLHIAQHQHASLSDIQHWAGVPWRLRLFDSLVVFQNYHGGEADLRWGSVDIDVLAAPEETNYPLTLTVTPGTEIGLKVLGHAGLFGPASLSMVIEGLETVLRGLARQAETSLSEILALLPESTRGAAAAAVAGTEHRRPAVYVAPGNDIERAIAEIWQDLFEVDQVGMDENFFDLGGQSMLLLQAHARLVARLEGDVPIVALFQYPTVRSLARHLNNDGPSNAGLDAARDRAGLQRKALARQRSRQGKR